MKQFNDLVKTADWKQEKHVPVIEAGKNGETINVKVSVGKEIAHPNTTAHHIAWIELYFTPDEGKFAYMLGRFDFAAHGASADGADSSTVYTMPQAEVSFKTEKSGTLTALSYCNIHGLWQSSEEIKL